MRAESWVRLLFILYCLEAGLFLFLAPWTGAWDRFAASLPPPPLRDFAFSTWGRGFVSALGTVHFAWVLHDADQLLRRHSSTAPDTESPGGR